MLSMLMCLFLLPDVLGSSPEGAPARDAQAFASIMADLRDREYRDVRRDFVAAARLMPAESYAFTPVDTIRSFGGEIAHVTAVNRRLCRLAAGEGEPAPGSTSVPATASKSELVAALEASFRTCDEAFAVATDRSALEPTFGPYIRASHFNAMVGHVSVAYGKLTIMLRLKGLVPPSTRAGG